MTAWELLPGTVVTRAQIRAVYGGGRQGGILPCKHSANILIYSDPAAGHRHGYVYDGWNAQRDIFLYTGEGQVGDQQLTKGNRAIAEHRSRERALRLFVAVSGAYPGGKLHRYIGAFEVDATTPHVRAPSGGRSVLVFRLRPVGPVADDPSIPVVQDIPEHDEVELVGPDLPPEAAADLVALENIAGGEVRTPGSGPAVVRRREAELVEHFRRHLEAQEHRVRRWKLRPKGELSPMWTDLFDEDANVLYEAKGTTGRDALRRGIGQLFDYRRHIPTEPQLALLLPERPSEDALDFIHSVGVACVYEAGGTYVAAEPPTPRQ